MSEPGFSQRPRQDKQLCVGCRQRKARFRYRGVVKADRDHTLCFRCFRAAANRLRLCGLYLPLRVRENPRPQVYA